MGEEGTCLLHLTADGRAKADPRRSDHHDHDLDPWRAKRDISWIRRRDRDHNTQRRTAGDRAKRSEDRRSEQESHI